MLRSLVPVSGKSERWGTMRDAENSMISIAAWQEDEEESDMIVD